MGETTLGSLQAVLTLSHSAMALSKASVVKSARLSISMEVITLLFCTYRVGASTDSVVLTVSGIIVLLV